MAGGIHPKGITIQTLCRGGLRGPDGQHYAPDGAGGFRGSDGRHLHPSGFGILTGRDKYDENERQINQKDEEERRRRINEEEEEERRRRIVEQGRYEEKQKNTPSREQIINIAWKASNAYSKFKMGTISKTEGQSAPDYNSWFKEKEEKAKRRWIERCKNGIERDCWIEPVVATKNKNTDDSVYKQEEAIEQNVGWDEKPLKPAHSGPIRKEKKNGVWKFSN